MRENGKEVLIIIPAYNEAQTIGTLLENIEKEKVFENCDILVVNDSSSDGTSDVVKARGHKVITHIYNLGYGSGLQTGYKYAKRMDYDYVIQLDADGQHDVSNISKIYDALMQKDENGIGPDIVIGSRFLKDSPAYKSTLAKNAGYFLFRTLIALFTGKKIMDPTSGLQGLSRRAFCLYSKYDWFDDKYPDANMITQMLLLGYRVEEIPALMHQRTVGKSMHSGLKPVMYMIKMTYMIFAVWFRFGLLKMDRRYRNNQSV